MKLILQNEINKDKAKQIASELSNIDSNIDQCIRKLELNIRNLGNIERKIDDSRISSQIDKAKDSIEEASYQAQNSLKIISKIVYDLNQIK